MDAQGAENGTIRYGFGAWVADPSRNCLSRIDTDHEDETHHNKIVTVTARAMDVLVVLLESQGRVVGKDELMDRVWQQRSVTDDVLVVCIYELRKALGDKARSPTFIETVFRRGYRFIPTVRIMTTRPLVLGSSHPEPSDEDRIDAAPQGIPSDPQLGRSNWIAASIAATLMVAGMTTGIGTPGAPSEAPTDNKTLLTASSTHGDPKLETDSSERAVDRTVDRTVEKAMGSWLAEARTALRRRTPESLDRAEQRFARVVEVRPHDARGYAGLARVATLRADLRLGDRFQLYHQARQSAERALELDPESADAHLALATIHLLFDWDFPRAESQVLKALDIEPRNPDAFQVYSWWLSCRSRHDEAVDASRKALALEPQAPNRFADLSFMLSFAGRGEEAVLYAQNALDLQPLHGSANAAMIAAQLVRGDERSATARLHPRLRSTHRDVMRRGRESSQADFWTSLGVLLERAPDDHELVSRAAVHAQAGEIERALGYLERAYERRDWEILWLDRLPGLAPLYEEPRFRKLIQNRESLAAHP